VSITFVCAAVCYSNVSVGVNCVFHGGRLSWQYHRITATRLVVFVVVSRGFCCCFSVLAKRLAGKSVAEMTYFMSIETLNLDSLRPVSQRRHSRNIHDVLPQTVGLHRSIMNI